MPKPAQGEREFPWCGCPEWKASKEAHSLQSLFPEEHSAHAFTGVCMSREVDDKARKTGLQVLQRNL